MFRGNVTNESTVKGQRPKLKTGKDDEKEERKGNEKKEKNE